MENNSRVIFFYFYLKCSDKYFKYYLLNKLIGRNCIVIKKVVIPLKTDKKPKISIFVSCHKPSLLPESTIFVPIHVGASKADERMNMLWDDTGDNISYKNSRFCELTAQYWAWKNYDADYYGFCHYRRFFSFSDRIISENGNGYKNYKFMSKDTQQELCLSEEVILEKIKTTDFIISAPTDYKIIGHKDLYSQYGSSLGLHLEDIHKAVDVLKTKYPAYAEAADEYMNGTVMFPCNMFIMKKELFNEYSSWLFSILREVDEEIDYSDYSVEGYRTVGHLAERLLGIFFTYQKKMGVKTDVLEWGFMEKTDPVELPFPAFSEKNVPVVFAGNTDTLPLLSVSLRSLIDHTSCDYNYDIIVAYNEIRKKDQQVFFNMTKLPNVSIRFLDVEYKISKESVNKIKVDFEKRLCFLIPELMIHYEKVLFLTSGVIILKDVAELFSLDISDYSIAAARDPICMAKHFLSEEQKMEVHKDENVQNKYVNTGVLLINLKNLRIQNSSYLAKELSERGFSDRVKVLAMRWNMITDGEHNEKVEWYLKRCLPREVYKDYEAGRESPFIVQYVGEEKPWCCPECDYSDLFWSIARQCPYYEVLVTQLNDKMNKIITEDIEQLQKFTGIFDTRSIIRKAFDFSFPDGSLRRKIIRKTLNIRPQ